MYQMLNGKFKMVYRPLLLLLLQLTSFKSTHKRLQHNIFPIPELHFTYMLFFFKINSKCIILLVVANACSDAYSICIKKAKASQVKPYLTALCDIVFAQREQYVNLSNKRGQYTGEDGDRVQRWNWDLHRIRVSVCVCSICRNGEPMWVSGSAQPWNLPGRH